MTNSNKRKIVICHEYNYLSYRFPQWVADEKKVYIDKSAFDELCELIEGREWDCEKKNGKGFAIRDKLFTFKNTKYSHYIQAQSFVGVLKLKSGTLIEFLPKFYLGDGKTEKEKNWTTRLKLAQLFAESHPQYKELIEKSDRGTFNLPLTEVGIKLYLNLITQLTTWGIKSGYCSQTENINCFHGKLDAAKQLQYNWGLKQYFYMTYDEFLTDIPENHLIKSSLLKIYQFSEDEQNKHRAQQLLRYFDGVHPSFNYDRDYNRKTKDRNFSYYTTAVDWSYALLNGKNLDTFFLGTLTNHTYLIPMEQLYESYVALKLEPKCRKIGWKMETQDEHSGFLFDEGPNDHSWQKIIPDIYIEANNHTIIMDTKWKCISDNFSDTPSIPYRYNIDRQDLYQMFVYAMRFHANDIWMLYPRNENQPKDLPLEFSSYNGDWPDINVHIFTIDLMNIDTSLNLLLDDVERAINKQKL